MIGTGPMSLTRRVIAANVTLYGLLLAVGRSPNYSSPSYTVVFELARDLSPHGVDPAIVWGVGFMVAGVLAQLRVGSRAQIDVGLFLLVLVAAGWVAGLLTAVWPRGVAQTWGGPIWPLTVVEVLVLNAGRRTIR